MDVGNQQTAAWQFNQRFVHDPVHNSIELDQLSWDIIDTPQFQRLRELKQLGTAYFVFPGASHNRFEHSIGVAHLAGKMIGEIAQRQPELELRADEIEAVRLAGLCHDLGHGPFSHVFDNSVLPRLLPAGSTWHHEQASEMMFSALVDENAIDLSTDQVRLINSLIDGTPLPGKRRFLYEIVANKKNSVDVDKFDYLLRDTKSVGLLSSYDPHRLIKTCRVIDDEICYATKEGFNVYELFHTRYSLFKRIYTHKTCNAIEIMVADALVHANAALHFTDAIGDPSKYLYLTDGILRDIETSTDPALAYSRNLIRRLRTRDTYKFVDEVIIEPTVRKFIKERLTPEEVAGYSVGNDNLRPDDIRIDCSTIHYGMGEKNPVDNIMFYNKFDINSKVHLKDTEASHLIPRSYCESVLRVYTTDPAKSQAVQRAFRRAVNPLLAECGSDASPSRLHNIPANLATPSRLKRRSFDEREANLPSVQPVAKVMRREWKS
ncbi:SAM domain and HD [Allomyces arbusculus]|nr:SAM domain and HD [Allomyces arbusculus]